MLFARSAGPAGERSSTDDAGFARGALRCSHPNRSPEGEGLKG